MKMIDTHCHLGELEYDQNRNEIIKRAIERDIVMITSATRIDQYSLNLELASSSASIYTALGLNPINHYECEKAISLIKEHRDSIIAIGECGLDHYLERDHDERKKQESVFVKMIDLALELKLPIQIHSRSAGAAALAVLRNNGAQRVHLHAFDGKSNLARIASTELGYYFSIPTSVVRSPQKRKLVKAVAIDRLLIETDSPVLSPVIGQLNEPANLPIALREIASILHMEEEEIGKIVLENICRLYSRIRPK
ncbi:MAG: TatD family hydrolase [Candidatus Thorarchaeota archaeon]|nr:TatD family hydrolase [Candidatus Thorarchaeota archaeon]